MICRSRGELSADENEGKITSNDSIIMIDVACVAGASKGKGERKINWVRAKRVGRGTGNWLLGLSRSPANENSALVRF